MHDSISEFEQRKQDHINLALATENQSIELNVFDQHALVHEALPDLNFDDIDISSVRFGRQIAKPFFVSSMTAGHKNANLINQRLLEACHSHHWAMGVGSQRRELFDKEAAAAWKPLIQQFSDVFLMSNLGIAQVLTAPLSDINRLIDVLHAKALIIHCNPLQEVIQPEGTPFFKGCWQVLEKLVKTIEVPIIIKETGCGFSIHTLRQLNDIGIAAVDISGAGGTHWGRIEGCRAAQDSLRNRAAQTFRNWGINTIQSVHDAVLLNPNYEVWGSGGVRHGLDAAKLLALGANMVGFAKPMLEATLQGSEEISQLMKVIEYELRVAMFCTGSANLKELKDKLCL